MSRLLHPVLLVFALFAVACNQKSGPKEVSAAFVKNLYTLKFEEAAAVTTDATKATLQKGKKDLEKKGLAEEEKLNRIGEQVETVFATKNLVAHTSGDKAVVQNEVLTIKLEKEKGQWKVQATEDLVKSVLYRQLYLENVRVAWQQLQEEYEKRLALVSEYLAYRNSYSGPSPETQRLDAALKKINALSPASGKERAKYIALQLELEKLLETNVQPTFTAASDLSLNFIIQLTTAGDGIKDGVQAYNDAASKARSKQFPPVPAP